MADKGIEKKKKGGAGKFFLVFFVIIIIIIGGFIALLKFDVMGLGTEIVGPMIKDIPGAPLILPEMPEETADGEGGEEVVSYSTLEEAIEILKVTENLLKEKEEEVETLSEQLTQLEEENVRLKVFEENYIQFEADKEAFDQFIADNSSSKDYISWYETIYSDNAAAIYEELKADEIKEEELQVIINQFNEMDSSEAAAILTEWSITRIEQVATIIKHLDPDQSAEIVGAMDESLASRIYVYLYPEQTN